MTSRRIVIMGVSSPCGGRLAQELERDPAVQAVVGIDAEDPRHELQRTEFVKLGSDPALVTRILRAASIDTIIDLRLIDDVLVVPLARSRQVNVLDTRKLLEAYGAAGSGIRKLIFKSSAQWYRSSGSDPAFLTEQTGDRAAPRSSIERDVVDAEGAVADFGAASPHAVVTILRFADALGAELRSSLQTLLNLPVVPAILGFDPRCQFIHQDDVVGVLAHAARHELPGVYNAAADGVLALSEVVSLLGKPLLPLLPPWGTVFAAAQLRRLGLPVPLELLRQLRAGRGLDNRKLKATGYTYRYTTRETVLKLRAHQRLRPLLGSGDTSYRYQRDVEEFLRWSPSVQSGNAGDGLRAKPRAEVYEELSEAELIEIISSLETEALRALRAYEHSHGRRRPVIQALDQQLERREAGVSDEGRRTRE